MSYIYLDDSPSNPFRALGKYKPSEWNSMSEEEKDKALRDYAKEVHKWKTEYFKMRQDASEKTKNSSTGPFGRLEKIV